ncbi:replicase [Galinsoga mosaic virus]|nr:replicase [Galinsoga mosaic virus]CAA73862.1 replicase [Galinsoga mosaic virus]
MGAISKISKISSFVVAGIVAYKVGKATYNAFRYRNQESITAARDLQAAVEAVEEQPEFGSVEECLEETPASQSERTTIQNEGDLAKMPVSRKRRIRNRKHGRFVSYLVNEAKAEYGLPKPTEAYRLMVGGFLNRLCKEWGVVTSHTHQAVSIALPLVFVPTKFDVMGKAMCATTRTNQLIGENSTDQATGWFDNVLGIGGGVGLRFLGK